MDRREALMSLLTGLGLVVALPDAKATSSLYSIGAVTIKRSKRRMHNHRLFNVYEDDKCVGELCQDFQSRLVWGNDSTTGMPKLLRRVEPGQQTSYWFAQDNTVIWQEALVERHPNSYSKTEILGKAILAVLTLRKLEVREEAIAKIEKLIEEGKDFRIV